MSAKNKISFTFDERSRAPRGEVGQHPISFAEPTGSASRLDEVIALVRAEVAKAEQKHPPMHSPHEGIAVIQEEVDELWEHVKRDTGRTPDARKEAIQIAAMGLRYVLNVAPLRPPCAACDRGDYQLGHADDCPQNHCASPQ